ncbi:hypothetical protein V7S43_009506 [Phytophthora oleae]|uniref:Fibronectin type-III domain-containing protein n=1 Tax=Phytophthora oleae TaxID=2107226 RepID=A0ABD3FIE1_9STRA
MGYRWCLLLAALAIGTVYSDDGAVGNGGNPIDADVAAVAIRDDKKTRSFVTPTHGSSSALTLTTFLTDAAHLHYAVLPSGRPALDAAGIKSAAAQCHAEVSEIQPPNSNNALQKVQSPGAVAANTVTISMAQKVVSNVENLLPNTSYDVYLVAEVIGSNGVFGSVQSVLQSTTHPEPPKIDITAVQPANATSDTVWINATLTTPGRAYFALIPPSGKETENVQLKPEDLVKNRTGDVKFQVAMRDIPLGTNRSYAFQAIVKGLIPATLYSVFVVTEAPGIGEVRSEVIRHTSTVRTHALAPEVSKLSCSPLNASATALAVGFSLEVDEKDAGRVTMETLSYFTYDLHYEVIALSDSSTTKKKDKVTTTTASVSGANAATRSTDDISALKNTTIRGKFSFGNFSTVGDFHASIKETHHANITGLESGTLYKVKLRTETAGSQGLFGLRELSAQAKTHEEAPSILAASVQATNKSVSSLTLTVDMERERGSIHYVLTGKTGAVSSLRSVFQQASSIDNLLLLLRERSPQDYENTYVSGVFNFSSDERVSVSGSKTPAKPGKPSADTEEEAFRETFMITGLEDATSYSIVLLPETSKSFGLFGRAFNSLLEAPTNENASEVELRSAKPLHGNITAVQLEVSMTKPKDILFQCLHQPTSSPDTEVTSDCQEVEDRGSFEASKVSPNTFTFTIGNLTEDTEYRVRLYAENAYRNGVVSKQSEQLSVRTHKSAPKILETSTHPTAASTSQVDAQVTVEPGSSCILHYVVRELLESIEAVDATTIVEHSSENSKDSRSHLRLPSPSSFVSGGNVLGALNEPTKLQVQGLAANTTYELFVVTETSREGNSSGVYGEPVSFNVTTHALAPKIVLATVDPVDGSTNSVIISANLSHPGMLHYFLSDVDFADPVVISSEEKPTPHELRGQVEILAEHILMEVINGTNDSRPTDPLVFTHNTTVSGLKPGTTYHVSLTTETYGSDGVFGEFPPPVLVNTHLGPPVIIPDTLSVHAVDGSSSALALDFQLDRFGEVHYALFFRGLVPDRSRDFESFVEHKEEGNESSPIWPPLISTFDLTKLNGSMLKAADFEELGVGVWENDTIKISREDVTRGKMTHKKIDKLPPNALFDVCLVSETAASGGILGWPKDGSASACHRVSTHGDYTNQSKLLDEISVRPMSRRTDGIRINLNVSKLLNASQSKGTNILDRFEESTGRVPYFVLIDSKSRSGRDLGGLTSRGEVASAFKEASPGRGDGVIAAGMLWNITNENSTALQIEQDVFGLEANHDYLLFFVYETSGSNGIFTRINPHKRRGNDTRSENDGIPVKTHELAPRIPKSKAEPTAGETSSITVKLDVSCESCKSAVVHLLLFPDHCKTPESVEKSLRLDQLLEKNVTINATEGDKSCTIPLVQKRVEFELPERHNRNDIEQELSGTGLLPNTSYLVLIATETAGAGVLSKTFEEPLRVRTHAPAPNVKDFWLEPRAGSTTELVLTFSLDRPGEIHYMLGPSGNDEFNVTSPHNISSKGVPNGDRRGRDRDCHNYRTEVVRTRRSVTYLTGEYVELLDYLMPGTSYSLFIVSEALPADHGVYGTIHKVKEVSTFANAPILLAHAAYPTPGTTKALTVGFRMDAPGIVYVSAVAVKPWDPMKHVAKGSDQFGNRLALKDQLVVQKSLDVTREMMELESDSGWREMALEVPHSELNYTVHLVTETKNSGGIFGTVATHAGVRAHSEAPTLVDLSVSPSDARVDALTVNVSLSDRGHVHYIALPSGRAVVDFSSELSVRASGSVDVNETGDQKTGFVIAGLTERSSYDLYFRSETFESFGVFGEWTTEPVTARTHGLPAEVLVEAVECKVTPSCEQRGRETCSRKENVCGKCLEGYEAVDETVPEANEPCVKLNVASEVKHGPKIKINSVTRNPNLHVSETELEIEGEREEEHEPMHSVAQEEPTLDLEAGQQDTTIKEHEKVPEPAEHEMMPRTTQEELTAGSKMNEQVQIPVAQDTPELAQGGPGDQNRPVTPDRDVDVSVDAQIDTPITPKAEPQQPAPTGCPLNAQPTVSGLCECIPGYEVDEGGTGCVLSRMETAAQAAATATSTAFDMLNAHSQISSQST